MKATLFWTTTTLFCLSFGFNFAAPAWAKSASESVNLSQAEDTVEVDPSEDSSADVLSVEPRGLSVGSEVDAEAWETVAGQINQGINDEEDEFLPEGVVMRGSENSLQLGSELP